VLPEPVFFITTALDETAELLALFTPNSIGPPVTVISADVAIEIVTLKLAEFAAKAGADIAVRSDITPTIIHRYFFISHLSFYPIQFMYCPSHEELLRHK
jgi:hypothetical protein